jgi:hypothetical protein
MRAQSADSLARISQFLGIDPNFPFLEKSRNRSESVSVTRPRLARLAYKSASLLRSLGADLLVEKSKRWFPRSLYWQKAEFSKEIPDKDLSFLNRELADEVIEWEKASLSESRHPQ